MLGHNVGSDSTRMVKGLLESGVVVDIIGVCSKAKC